MSLPGHYSIGAAGVASGLTTYTIRMWERRYGAVVPPRTAGRSRLYSQADVDRLKKLRRLTDAGHAIRHVATLPIRDLDHLLAAVPAPVPDTVVERFLAALHVYDVAEAELIVMRAAALLDPRTFVTDVAVPILAAIGDRWHAGKLRVYREHTASTIVRSALSSLLRVHGARSTGSVAVVGTLTGEHHQLGALMVALLVAVEGWRVILLDHEAPAVEVRDAAVEAGARVVLLSFVGAHRASSQRELDELVGSLPAGIALFAGGRSAPSYLTRKPRARLLGIDALGETLGSLVG